MLIENITVMRVIFFSNRRKLNTFLVYFTDFCALRELTEEMLSRL